MAVLLKSIMVMLLWSAITVTGHAQVEGQFHDAEGRPVRLGDLQNKWLIINYWADWCDSCVEEIPELNNFYQHNQNKNIVLIGVNYDQLSQPDLKQAMQKSGITFPVLLEDPKLLWQLGEISVLPTTFIINPQGDVVKKIIGPNTERSLLKIINNRFAAKNKVNKLILTCQ